MGIRRRVAAFALSARLPPSDPAVPPLRVLYADECIAIVDKPAGLIAHESRIAAGEIDTVLARARAQLQRPAWLAHRLDRATSGCLLLGLQRELMPLLGAEFMERRVEKSYLAVVRGWPEQGGSIEHPLDGGPGKPDRRDARTDFTRLATAELPIAAAPHASARYALLECRPHSGRFRQIRRHLKHINHHLIGDTSHGDGRHNRLFRQHLGVHRMLLHAWRLAFVHPVSGQRVEAVAPLDQAFERAFDRLGWPLALAGQALPVAPA